METRVVLVTGTSSGIGLALLKRLMKRVDLRIVATALPTSMQVFQDIGVVEHDRLLLRPLDVRDLDSIPRLVHDVERIWGRIDVVINNAGVSFRGVVEDITDAEEYEQMLVNYLGPHALMRAVLPGMRERRCGHIINVSSVSGMMAMPTMSSYSASKWSLEGASEALWYEMRPFNVHITLIQPGFVNSDSFRKVKMPASVAETGLDHSPYRYHYEKMTAFVTWLMQHAISTPDSIARVLERQMNKKHPPLRVQATVDAWVFNMLRRFVPRRLYHPLLYALLPGIRNWGKRIS